jgi:nucleotidyltransferase substrate binding protein (TIGR01987 family)
MSTDTRWRQRYANFQNALKQLDAAVDMEDDYSDLERQGLIQYFEYTVELAWKVLQDLLGARGYEVKGPKPVIKQAFQDGLISDGDVWINMLDSRNETSHSYDKETALDISNKIITEFYPLLDELDKTLAQLSNEE